MSNEELFAKYYQQLHLRVRNPHNYDTYIILLEKYKEFLGDRNPSHDLAIEFVSGYWEKAPRTQDKYAAIIKGFMTYYGEPIDDLKIKRPSSLPEIVKDVDIDKFLEVVRNKQSHKKTIDRDSLLFELYLKTGMRRSELADLVVEHIYEDYLMVRKGKGLKDRMIPLLPDLADRLHKYIRGKNRNESVFGLQAVSITNKVTIFAKKAGVNIHTHSFRHKYATELIRRGANIRAVQELMGHSNINTTQGYAAVTNTDLIETVKLLQDTPETNTGKSESSIQNIIETLESKTMRISDLTLNAKDIFYQIRTDLMLGIGCTDILRVISKRFETNIPDEATEQISDLFTTYAYLGLIETKPQSKHYPYPHYEESWIPTESGKKLLKHLAESK